MLTQKISDAEIAVRRAAVPLLTIRAYLRQRGCEPPVTVSELAAATGIPQTIVRECVRALLRSGFPAEVYDAVCVFPSAFEVIEIENDEVMK